MAGPSGTWIRRLNEPLVGRSSRETLVRYSNRHLTGAGKVLVVCGLILGLLGLNIQEKQAFILWSGLFGIGLSSVILVRFHRLRLEMTRTIASRVSAGSEVGYRVRVTNRGLRPVHDLTVRDELPTAVRSPDGDGDGVLIPYLAPGETAFVTLRALFERRGRHVLAGLRGEHVCPLGLTRAGRPDRSRSPVTVYPRTLDIHHIDFTTASTYQPGGIPYAGSVGESAEFVGLREYRAGDPLRHVSWNAWARTGQPVVREFQGEYYRRVALILDTRCGRSTRDRDHFEAAVTLAASVVTYFERHEYIIDLFAAGPDLYYIQTGMGLSPMDQVLELLACVEPSTQVSLPRLDEPLRRILNRLSGVVMVTQDWWPESREFHGNIVHEVPELKLMLVRSTPARLDPTADVPEGRLLRVLDPGNLEEEVLDL